MQGCLEAMVAMPTGDVRLFLSTYNIAGSPSGNLAILRSRLQQLRDVPLGEGLCSGGKVLQ